MPLVQPNGTVGRTGLRSRRTLALLVVLVLSGGALIFDATEARAKQQRPAPVVHAVVTGQERTPVSGVGRAGPGRDEPATRAFPAGSSRANERDAGYSSAPEPDPATSGAPGQALALPEEDYLAPWVDLLPEAATPESFGVTLGPAPAYGPTLALPDSGPVPGPRYPVQFVDPPPAPGPAGFEPTLPYPGAPEPVRGLVASEESKPPASLPASRLEERLPAFSPTDTLWGAQPAPYVENGAAKAVPVGPSPPVVDRKAPPPGLALQEPPVPGPPTAGPSREATLMLSSLGTAASSAVETLHGAAPDISETLAPGGEALAETPSAGGTKEPPPEDAPPPPAPFEGSYFSLWIGGQVGPGFVVPLLICVLAAGLILLRPLVGRLSWASCELPKPASVLLLPLERPG